METHWLGPGDPWPPLNALASGAPDLIVIQAAALQSSDLEWWRERQRSLAHLPHVLLGLPAFLLLPSGLSHSEAEKSRALPRATLRDYFSYGNFHWFLGGLPFSFNEGQRSRAEHLSDVLASLYRCAPGPFPGSSKDWARVVRALLENQGRLKVSASQLADSAGGGFFQTLRKFFLEPGLLVSLDSGLGWLELRLSGAGPGGWLSFLLETLYGKESSHGIAIEDLMRALSRPPYGVRGSLARHLVCIAASCHVASLWYDGPSAEGGTHQIQQNQLPRLLEKGVGKLHFRPASPAEQLLLRSLRQLFRPLVETRIDLALDPWEQTRKDVLHWYAELASWTRCHRHSHSPQALALLSVCREAHSCDSRTLLRIVVPEAFRWKEIPLPAEQAYFIDQINVARLELEGFLRRFQDKLSQGLHLVLVGEQVNAPRVDLATAREWLIRGRRSWVGGFLSGTFEGSAFSPWAEGLLSALSGLPTSSLAEGGGNDVDLEERWFVQLPRDLGLSPVREWETDHTRLFLSRLGRARLELELGRFQEYFGGFSGPRKAETARNWTHLVLSGDDVPAEVAEEILALVLDDLE